VVEQDELGPEHELAETEVPEQQELMEEE